jgi:hypothetical protein
MTNRVETARPGRPWNIELRKECIPTVQRWAIMLRTGLQLIMHSYESRKTKSDEFNFGTG